MTGLKPCPFCGCEMVLKPTLMCDNKTIRYEPTAKASVNHGKFKRLDTCKYFEKKENEE